MLFVARAADSEVNYREDSVKEINNAQGRFRSVKSVRNEKEFTTKVIDISEVSTSVTTGINDTGFMLYNVEAILPYMDDSSKLEGYLEQMEQSYARSSADESYKVGSVEKGVAFIQRELKKLQPHPRFFCSGGD